MWVFTTDAFVSIVRNRNVPALLLVRARDQASIKAFCHGARVAESEIIELDNSDYRYRVSCSEQALGRWLRDSAEGIAYANFKSAASEARGRSWHDALMQVWSVMRSLQPGPSGR